MSISTLQPFGILVAVAPLIVGATFLWAGAIKAIAPHVFQAHVRNLGWIPARQLAAAVVAATALETGWGTALILGVAPRVVLPLTAIALVILTFITWWGIHSGRTTDCGCYGGYVVPSLAQSVALNGALIVLSVLGWLLTETSGPTPSWKLLTAVATGVIAGVFAAVSLRFLEKNGRFLVDMSPLKPGREWHERWGATIPVDETEHMVSYLGPDCPALQAVGESPERDGTRVRPSAGGRSDCGFEPDPRSIHRDCRRSVSDENHSAVADEPIGLVSPTTVLVSGGKIQEKWSGQMPPEFFQRFKAAFFPTCAQVGAEYRQAVDQYIN
jgi:uncharacterized membrane protein YphA (DoxX/SURF4 family)